MENSGAIPHAADIDVNASVAEVKAIEAQIAALKARYEPYRLAVNQVYQDTESDSDMEDEADSEGTNAQDVIEACDSVKSELETLIYQLGYLGGDFFSSHTDELAELYKAVGSE